MSRIKTDAAPKSVVSGTDTGLKIGSGGAKSLSDLDDVDPSLSPEDGDILVFNGVNFSAQQNTLTDLVHGGAAAEDGDSIIWSENDQKWIASNIKPPERFTFWQPDHPYKVGDIVAVVWDNSFLATGKMSGSGQSGFTNATTLDNIGNKVVFWICVRDITGPVAAAPGEPAGITKVPPGYCIITHYNIHGFPYTFPQNNPRIWYDEASWMPLHQRPGQIHYFETIFDFATLRNDSGSPILPGDYGIVRHPNSGNTGDNPHGDPPNGYIGKLFSFHVKDSHGSMHHGYWREVEYVSILPPVPGHGETAPAEDQTIRLNAGTNVPEWVSFPEPPPALPPHVPADLHKLLAIKTDGTLEWTHKIVDLDDPVNTYDAATKGYVDDKVAVVATGVQHGAAAVAYLSDPPAAPVAGQLYIIKDPATGVWKGHENNLALWTGTAWNMAPAQAHEAHLVQADNAIYHWSGTKWNMIASAAAGLLAQLGDVDTQTSSPKTGDLLIFDGTKWKPSAQKNNAIFQTADGGYGAVTTIDLGQDKWTRAEIRGELFIGNDATAVSFMPKTKNNIDCITKAMCYDFYCQLRYGNSYEVKATGMDQWFVGNNPGLTWLANVNGSNDRISGTTFRSAEVSMDIQLYYDREFVINTYINYWSYGGTSYRQYLRYRFKALPADKGIQKISFIPSQTTSTMFFNGRSTVY